MLTFRPFRNTDPPLLNALWRAHVGRAGLPAHITAELLEQLVFSRLYFDYAGLILAFDDDRFLGFVHAGFGPSEARDAISHATGVIALLLVQPGSENAAVPLIGEAESYLRARGAETLVGGGVRPACPFYTGLYGLSEPSGVIDSDTVFRDALLARGFQPAEQTVTYQRELTHFEAPIDRQQMEIRRRMMAEVAIDAPTTTWWDACLWSEFDLTRFDLVPRGTKTPAAYALFRHLEPVGSSGAYRGAGLIDLQVDPAYRRRGLAVFLLCEACRQFARQGIVSFAAQAWAGDAAVAGLLKKLGMKPALTGTQFRKA